MISCTGYKYFPVCLIYIISVFFQYYFVIHIIFWLSRQKCFDFSIQSLCRQVALKNLAEDLSFTDLFGRKFDIGMLQKINFIVYQIFWPEDSNVLFFIKIFIHIKWERAVQICLSQSFSYKMFDLNRMKELFCNDCKIKYQRIFLLKIQDKIW